MKKTIFICLSIFLYGCTQKATEKNCATFAESPDPDADTAVWISNGFNVSFGSTDLRYKKYKEPQIEMQKTHRLYAWKGERVSAQIVVWTSASVQQLECQTQDLKCGNDVIPSEAISARFVRYTLTDIFEPGCGYRKPENFPVSLIGDMLDNIECIDMETRSVRPIWITVNVPDSIIDGTYKGEINVSARGKKSESLKLEIEVSRRILPPASRWKYHLDLWQHPAAAARIQNLKLWSDEHFDALRPLMKMLADAGQKVITATVNKDPWNHQCYDAYEDMIIWTKNGDGSWSYDYSVFDRWVKFMMDMGIKKMINCYSMAPWNNELHYKDAISGNMITVKADPGTKEFVEMWSPFLKDFVQHLRENNWLEITNIAMDERPPAVMDEILGLLDAVAPELGVAFADNHKSYKKYPHIKDLCVDANSVPDADELAARQLNGLNTTYYVCCADKFPNMFTFSDPLESVYAAWYAKANGLDGFLRWAYNSWVENPVMDSRFRTWPAGDTFIVYPEARSSIRFERLIEGIQDYEKLSILIDSLEKKIAESDSENHKNELLTELEAINLILDGCKNLDSGNMKKLIESGKVILRK
jgi:hypothetical protein